MKICPSCNIRYSNDNQFCSKCGTDLVEEALENRSVLTYWKNLYLLPKPWIVGIPLILILASVFFFFTLKPRQPHPPHPQVSVRVLDQSEVDSLTSSYLDKDLLASRKRSGAIAIGNKIFLLVITEMKGANKSKIYEIQNELPIDYRIKGDLPVFGGDDDKLLINNITGDNIPDFIYYTSKKTNNNRSFSWSIINIPKREIAVGDYTISSEIYGNNHISLNSVADDNEFYKKYILDQIASKKQEIYSEEGNEADKDSIQKLLIDYWMKTNGIDCSKLLAPCKLQLLWIYFANDSDILNVPKNAEAENDKYKVVALAKYGVYFIDKSNNKVALIYLPEDSTGQIKRIKIIGDKVILYKDSKKESDMPIIFDLKETTLKKVKDID